MVNLYTKFEVSRCTHYEVMNSGANCRRWDGLGSLKIMGNVTIRYSTYDFLFIFNRNYVAVLFLFQAIASCLSKVADFNLPRLHLEPPLGVTPVEFR